MLLRNTLDHGTPVGIAAKHQWEFRQNIIGSFSATPLGIPSGYQGVFFWNITGSPLDPRTVLGRLWPLFRAFVFLLPWASLSVRPSFRPTSLAPSPPFSGFPLSHSASGPGPHGAPGPPGAPSGGNDDAGRLRCRSLAGAGWLRQGWHDYYNSAGGALHL